MAIVLDPSVLDTALFIPDLRTRRKESVLHELVARAVAAGVVREAALLIETLSLRERLGPTSIGKAVAVPHARSIAVIEPRILVARSRRGIEWKASDGLAVQLVFLVITPGEFTIEAHLDWVARAVACAKAQRKRVKLMEAATPEAGAAVLRELTL